MQFSCSRSALENVLNLLSSVVPLRSGKAVLQNILVEGDASGCVVFTGTDLEIGLQLRLGVQEIKDPEKVLLPAAQLAATVRGGWEETLTITVTEGAAEIRTAETRVRLLGSTAVDEYPPFPAMDETKQVEISGADLGDAAAKTVFATARGDTRFAMNGVLLHIEKGQVEFVASDTHRLSLVKKRVRNPSQERVEAIVITKGIMNLAKIAAGQDTVAHVLWMVNSRATARSFPRTFPLASP